MSMIGNFKLVTPAVYRRLVDDPSGIVQLLYPEADDDDGVPGRVSDLDVDKAWHGLHFLFTGTGSGGDEPLNFIVSGGTPLGDEDVGYGPARGFDAARVKAIDEALRGLTRDELRRRYVPDSLTKADIYPNIWQSDGDDAFAYLQEYFENLRAFMAAGARDDQCLLVYIN